MVLCYEDLTAPPGSGPLAGLKNGYVPGAPAWPRAWPRAHRWVGRPKIGQHHPVFDEFDVLRIGTENTTVEFPPPRPGPDPHWLGRLTGPGISVKTSFSSVTVTMRPTGGGWGYTRLPFASADAWGCGGAVLGFIMFFSGCFALPWVTG